MGRVVEQVFQDAVEEIDSHKTVERTGSIFEFEPVSLDVFVRDKQFLGLPPLSPKQYEAVEYATQIYYPETLRDLKWKRLRYVAELVLLWGKGSGKDFVSRVMLLRIAYLLLALKNPQGYYWGKESPVGLEAIHMLNTASTKDQAGNVFFSPLRRYVQRSPFFKNRAEVLSSEIKFEKAIFLLSGHSEAEAQEGLNPIAVILDEIAAFKTDDEVADLKRLRLRKNMPQSASAIYDFATSSIMTRFPKVGKVVLLSFPRFEGDFITTKYAEGKDDAKVFTSFGATFEVNPVRKKADFAREARLNPARYKCRILCTPEVAEDAFFKNQDALKRAFDKNLPDPLDKSTGRFLPEFFCTDGLPRFGHVDLAKNRCRAAFSFVHAYDVKEYNLKTDDGDTIVVEVPLIKLDVLAYFQALPGGEISFERIRSMLLEFTENRGFYIKLLTFDGYQSIQMMQSLEAHGVTVDLLSIDKSREAYEAWQDAMYDGRFLSYYSKILVEEEIPFLIDYRGKKIEHRTGRGKDGADAVAGAVLNCMKSGAWASYEFWHK